MLRRMYTYGSVGGSCSEREAAQIALFDVNGILSRARYFIDEAL